MKDSQNKMKHVIIIIFSIAICLKGWSKDTLQVSSPLGKIAVKVWMGKQLQYQILYDNKVILAPSSIDFLLDKNRSLSSNNSIKSSSVKKVREQIISPVPEKRKVIPDVYNVLSVAFKQPYKVEFRVYDDGVAYRISTMFKDSIYVNNEVAEFAFPGTPSAYFPKVQKREDSDIFHTSFEEEYPLRRIDTLADGVISYSPILVAPDLNPKIAITESDLEDYPGMFLGGTGSSMLKGVFAPYPLEEQATEALYSELKVTKRAPYIARTRGTRSFPWRVLLIAAEDKELPSNDIVYRLGAPSRIGDASWVKPGNLTDEWTIDINLFNVPFRAGLNTNSYKYYIDFAKRFGFDRIMMDAGWSDNNDLFKITPTISMDTLVAYAKEKGIKISMWTLSKTLDRQLDSALNQFNKWGVDFIMTDFIDRDDQKTVNFYHRIAKACADHKIMIMYHGAFPPKGFNRTYPNAVAREGVMGSEFNIWSNRVTPEHDVTLPFTRMLAGGFDYEPGLLNNATKKGTRPVAGVVTSPGTRCHQLAMFVVYDSPMQIFSGNPSEGMREAEFMSLLGNLPTAWDETVVTDGKVGEFIVSARKKGNDWFVGGMSNWSERDVSVKFDFLSDGNYKATICKDGINADRYAADYVIQKDVTVKKNDEMKIHIAPGGGFLIRLDKE
ncbi:glycoside hydrolase family 97 protein [Segetibacter koreensis]|uniref:glycoside hydrolase family 97 protein n=1 Tax=Segetibacter koreensis TaxID=398037 RepID=UPI0003718F6C|nr:glycoside hydrolase family 97 protein [Segetibacter koreensis]